MPRHLQWWQTGHLDEGAVGGQSVELVVEDGLADHVQRQLQDERCWSAASFCINHSRSPEAKCSSPRQARPKQDEALMLL